MDLEARRNELEQYARERGVISDERPADVPSDPVGHVAGLATLLGFDAHRAAVHPDFPVAALAAQAQARQEALRTIEQQLQESAMWRSTTSER
jgi:hypothetical protein